MRNKTWIPTALQAAALRAATAMVLGLSVMPLPLKADTGFAPLQGVASAGQLAKAQSQAALLQAKLEIATLEAKIKKVETGKSDKSTPLQGANPVTSPYQNMGIPQSMPIQQSLMQNRRHSTRRLQAFGRLQAPRVLSLMGVAPLQGAGAHYTATLALPDGTIMSVRPGMDIGDGWKVTRVNSDGVLATHNGKVEPLAFSAQSGPSGASQGMGDGGQTAPSFAPPNMGGAPGMGAPMLPNGAPMQITPPTGLPPAGLPGQGG